MELLNTAYIVKKLGSRYENTTLDNFRGDAALKIKPIFESGKNIFILGECGTGKTHLIAALAHTLSGKRYCIVNAIRINDIASDPFGDSHDYCIRTWSQTPVLFIDDIGIGRLTQERSKIYYEILNYRVGNKLQTVFTANKKTTDLWRGDNDEDPARIIRRIREDCEGVQL